MIERTFPVVPQNLTGFIYMIHGVVLGSFGYIYKYRRVYMSYGFRNGDARKMGMV